MSRIFNDDRAVSESLGYILIFGIVLSCIALIMLFGNDILNSAKADNNFKSIEQGMTIVISDLKQVALEGTPVKTARIHMEGGSISANKDTNQISISFNGHSYTNNTGNITYISNTDNSRISIENGGLWERDVTNGTDIIVLKPRIYNTTFAGKNTLMLNLIRFNAASDTAVGGSATIDVILRDQSENPPYTWDAATPQTVDITFNTDYPNAWARFFAEEGATTTSTTTDSVTAHFTGISRVIINENMISATVD
jgi:hypothetical protein